MGDAVICEQLGQIFPQIDIHIIQRTVQEARSSNEVDILTHCIEAVLARQDETIWLGNNHDDQQGNNDIGLKSIQKEHIPVVYISSDDTDESARRSSYSNSTTPSYQSSDDENSLTDDVSIKKNYCEDSVPIRSQLPNDLINPLPKENHSDFSSPIRSLAPDNFAKTISTLDLVFNGHQQQQTAAQQPPLTYVKQPSIKSMKQTSNSIKQASASPTHSQQHAPMRCKPVMRLAETPSEHGISTTASLLSFIKEIFPNASSKFVENLHNQGHNVNEVVNILIDRPDMQNSVLPEKQPSQQSSKIKVDYFTDYSKQMSSLYCEQCERLLRNQFRRISCKDIKRAMRYCNNHYAPTYKILEEAMLSMDKNICESSQASILQNATSTPPTQLTSKYKNRFFIKSLLANKRPLMFNLSTIHSDLQLEIDYVKKQETLNEEKKDAIYAAKLNKQQYLDEGELIECGCCYGSFPFEEIVQCSDGHLFCKECLSGYSKEVIFGSSMTCVKLICLVENCGQPFPYNQLEKCLTNDEINKYQSRLQEDCLAKADIENLHQCPFCEFAAIIPDQQKVFKCVNSKCMKESCIECKEEWEQHFGKKCNEIEKKSQKNLRLSYEEKMTAAKVRKCSKCSLTFTKLDGCNKMTCRCGMTQCYVCRESSISYKHFCAHPRDPGMKCQSCTACSLWTNVTEDDDLAIKQIQREAIVEKRKLLEEIEQGSSKKQKV